MENLLQNIVDQARADQGGCEANLPSRNAPGDVIIPPVNAAAEEPPVRDCKMSVPPRNAPAGDPPAEDHEMSLPLKHAVAGNSPPGDPNSSGSNQSYRTDSGRSPRPVISRPILTQRESIPAASRLTFQWPPLYNGTKDPRFWLLEMEEDFERDPDYFNNKQKVSYAMRYLKDDSVIKTHW